MNDFRAYLRRLRRRVPPTVGGAAVNVGRLTAILLSRDTLHMRDLGELHETHLLTRRAAVDRANELVARYSGVARQYGQWEELSSREARVQSQNGEDGILLHLLSSMTVSPVHRALEIGSGGWSSNIANLVLHFGFDGVFVDASTVQLADQRRRLAALAPDALTRAMFVEAWVRPASFATDARSWAGPEMDVLSVDIDSVDYWLFAGLDEPLARIVVAEYNASFGPTARLTVPMDEAFDRWSAHPSGYYYGASLAALDHALSPKGYALVGTESSGVNAFFVRDDVLPEGLVRVPPSDAYHPDARRRHVPQAEQEALLKSLGPVEV